MLRKNRRRTWFIASAVGVLASAVMGHAQPYADTINQNSLTVSPMLKSTGNAGPMQTTFTTAANKLQAGEIPQEGSINLVRLTQMHVKSTTSPAAPNQPKTQTKKPVLHQPAVRAKPPQPAASTAQPQAKTQRHFTHTVSHRKALPPQTDVNLYWLSRAVEAEAGGEPNAVKLAVANVILNRVHSSLYPDTVKGVIFQRVNGVYAFTSVQNGWIYHQPSAASTAAAREALYGHRNIVPLALVFYNNKQTSASNWVRTKPVIARLGAMTFAG